ncbi:receptor-type tyrosine-protein phosphatase C, partial [Biomphalaria pfeifferi]
MSQSLVSCIGLKFSQLKVMCGLSMDSSAREERAIDAVDSDPIPSGVFLAVYKEKLQGKQLAIEFKALSKNEEQHSTNAALRNVLMNSKQEVVT